MNVLHLSAASINTGAGKAAHLTHVFLSDRGINSRFLFLKQEDKNPTIHSYHHQSLLSRIKRVLVTKMDDTYLINYPNKEHVLFSPGLHGLSLKEHYLIKWADVIHIHWANHGFIDIKEVGDWNKPVVWTLRDMWAFTGGCHHAFSCNKYQKTCGKCPILGSANEADLSTKGQIRKLQYLGKADISWVAISTWMKERAQESTILSGKEIRVIPSGVSSERFQIGIKAKARKDLGISPDEIMILTGATNLREAYKGFEYSREALKLADTSYRIFTFGDESFEAGEIPQQVFHMGFVDEKKLNSLLAACDVFLAPSVAEAMGKVHLEAQLSGVPVVCFENTGPEDFVLHKETGYVSRFCDAQDLLKGIEYCVKTDFNREKIRENALSLDITNVVESYITLYEESMLDWSNRS